MHVIIDFVLVLKWVFGFYAVGSCCCQVVGVTSDGSFGAPFILNLLLFCLIMKLNIRQFVLVL